jgi:ABC-2 type transport system permease protein
MQGMAWAVVGDREHWRTLRYVYTAPVSFRAYLVGRALALVASSSAAVVVTLLFGWAVLGVPLRLEPREIPYFLCAWAAGVTGVLALGLATAAGVLCVSGDAWRMPEAVGAALYLVSGALFPVPVLPEPLRQVASALPVSWWLEALRRVWLPANTPRSFPWASDFQVLGTVVLLAAVLAACALLAFGLSERRARQLGILDRETGY